jgi:orotidine-5'-phosphate decarboxylase
MPHPATIRTYAERAELHTNPTAKRLLGIMERKRSNLCVSVDVSTTAEALQVIRRVGASVCMVKVSASLFSWERGVRFRRAVGD